MQVWRFGDLVKRGWMSLTGGQVQVPPVLPCGQPVHCSYITRVTHQTTNSLHGYINPPISLPHSHLNFKDSNFQFMKKTQAVGPIFDDLYL